MLNQEVLRRKQDFSAIYKKGKSTVGKYVIVFCLKNNYGYNRRAFLASKKVGNSVKRNRARRLMKESVRELLPDINESFDLIFIARNTINNQKKANVKKSIEVALKKLNLINN